MGRTVRVTHPFHPLHGRELRLLYSKHCWGLDRVFCEGEDGKIRSFPTAWTDLRGRRRLRDRFRRAGRRSG